MSVRFRGKPGRLGGILKGEGVQAMLRVKAEAIALDVEAAGIRVEGVPGRIALPVQVSVGLDATRAVARVTLAHPSGQAVEAKHGVLLAGLDAAKVV